jgi:hypothetical protein
MWRTDKIESAQPDSKRAGLGIHRLTMDQGGPHGLWVRYPRDLEAVCYALHPPKSHMWISQVRMLWVDGCCLSSPETMQAGDEFWCRFHCRRRPLTTMLRMFVNEVTQDDDQLWFLSCAFDHALTHKDCCILL